MLIQIYQGPLHVMIILKKYCEYCFCLLGGGGLYFFGLTYSALRLMELDVTNL